MTLEKGRKRVIITIPERLHEIIKKAAKGQNLNISQYLTNLGIAEYTKLGVEGESYMLNKKIRLIFRKEELKDHYILIENISSKLKNIYANSRQKDWEDINEITVKLE